MCTTKSVKFCWIPPKLRTALAQMEMLFFGLKEDILNLLKQGSLEIIDQAVHNVQQVELPLLFLSKLLCNLLPFAAIQPPCYYCSAALLFCEAHCTKVMG